VLCKQVARAAEYARQFQYRDQDWPSNETGVHATATVAAEAAVGRVVEPGNEVGEALTAGARAVGVADAVSAAVVDTAGVGVLSLGLMFTDWNDIDITLTICF